AAAKEVDGATLKQRRLAATARWKTWLDVTVRGVIAGKITLDDKKALALDGSASEDQMPTELADDVKKWRPAVHATIVVFHDFGGALVDPPKRYTVSALSGGAQTRTIAEPTVSSGPLVNGGVGFVAIARGSLDGVSLLVAGDPKTDPVQRLASAKL